MCREYLRLIYDKQSAPIRRQSAFAGEFVGSSGDTPLPNLSDAYAKLFAPECSKVVRTFYDQAFSAMRDRAFENSADLLNALEFLQHVLATAMWKYHLTVDSKLQQFTHEFDRLDVSTEKERLHALAQRI